MTGTADLAPRRLRGIFGTFATGLTVITSATESGPAGFTCQSFASLSLEPALVTFSPARTSRTWPVLRQAGSFAINILPMGNPVLDDALAWIDCTTLHAEYAGGDHTIVVAAVRHLSARQDAEPLLFFKGRNAGITPAGRVLEAAH